MYNHFLGIATGHPDDFRQVFFGPEGTMTPLHSDPYENIFCQAGDSPGARCSPRKLGNMCGLNRKWMI
jgi:hypothetical protein